MPTFVRTQEIVHAIGARGRLEVQLTSADVRLRPSDSGEARVRAIFELHAGSDAEADELFEAVQLHVERSTGALRVSEPTPRRGGVVGALSQLLGRAGHAGLTVEMDVPRLAELRLQTVSGDVNGSGLAGEQRYQTVSGDLYLTELGGSVRLNTVSGDATLRAVDTIAVRAEAVSGDLSIRAPRLDAFRATSVSGDVGVDGAFAARGDHRVETVSGDLDVALAGGAVFDVRGLSTDVSCAMPHQLEGRADRRRVTVAGGGATLVFSSMSGDLSIRGSRDAAGAISSVSAEAAAAARTPAEVNIDVLRALERGEIDVEEAARLLEGTTDA